jgi:hypothetical protein
MQHALAAFYGTGAVAKTSSAEPLKELHLARRVIEHLDGCGVSLLKASEADLAKLWEEDSSDEFGPVSQMGGPTEALQKASELLPRVRAWQRGERDGAAIARYGIKASFERAGTA